MPSEARSLEHGARLSLRLREASTAGATYGLELAVPTARWRAEVRFDAQTTIPEVRWADEPELEGQEPRPAPTATDPERPMAGAGPDPALAPWLRLLFRSIHQQHLTTGRWPRHLARWRNPERSPAASPAEAATPRASSTA